MSKTIQFKPLLDRIPKVQTTLHRCIIEQDLDFLNVHRDLPLPVTLAPYSAKNTQSNIVAERLFQRFSTQPLAHRIPERVVAGHSDKNVVHSLWCTIGVAVGVSLSMELSRYVPLGTVTELLTTRPQET